MIIINIAGIEPNSLVNGPGLRYVLFTQGCIHHCEGCQNEHTWPLECCREMTVAEIFEDIKNNMPLIEGVTLSGGDPMEQAVQLYELCNKIKQELHLNIWCYTGYTLEEINKCNDSNKKKLLTVIDVLVDGRFDINDINGDHPYRGSNNQKIINLTKGRNSK